jgi:hypothetical protein
LRFPGFGDFLKQADRAYGSWCCFERKKSEADGYSRKTLGFDIDHVAKAEHFRLAKRCLIESGSDGQMEAYSPTAAL